MLFPTYHPRERLQRPWVVHAGAHTLWVGNYYYSQPRTSVVCPAFGIANLDWSGLVSTSPRTLRDFSPRRPPASYSEGITGGYFGHSAGASFRPTAMSTPFFEQVIFNCPCEAPARYWELNEHGQPL